MTWFYNHFIEQFRVIHLEENTVTTNMWYFQITIEWYFIRLDEQNNYFSRIILKIYILLYFRIEATSATLVLPGMPLPGSHFCSCYLCANFYLNLIPKLRINEQPCLATTGCGSTASRGSFNRRVRRAHFIWCKSILKSMSIAYIDYFNLLVCLKDLDIFIIIYFHRIIDKKNSKEQREFQTTLHLLY